MSDLDATSSRGQSAARITAVASGKLRSLSGTAPVFAEANGLADAFAEVFSRIAASSWQPIESRDSISDPESTQLHSNEQSADSGPSTSDESESLDVAVESYAEVEPQETETVDASPIQEMEIESQFDNSAVERDNQPVIETEIIDIATAKVDQSEVHDAEIETPDVIVRSAQPDEPEHRRPTRHESTTAEPVDNTEGERRPGNRATSEDPIRGNSEEVAENNEQTLESTDRELSPRRLRGRHRRDRETMDQSSQPVSQSSRGRVTQAVSAAASNTEAVASQVGQSPDAATRPATENAKLGIVNVQSIAAKIQQTGTANAAQSVTRGSTQAVQSTASTRTAPRAKLDSPTTHSNAAKTVSRIKLIQRVSKAFQHLGPEGGVVRLRLAPAEMGSVRVEMRIKQRTVQARVVAETQAASEALREHLPDLRARLESFGMQVEKIEVETETSDRSQRSQFDADSQQRNGQRQNDDGSGRSTPGAHEPVSPQVPRSTSVYQIDAVSSGVDVRL